MGRIIQSLQSMSEKFVCGSQPEIKDGSEQEGRTERKQRESKEVKRPKIDSAIIEELMKGYERPSDLIGPGGSWKSCTSDSTNECSGPN